MAYPGEMQPLIEIGTFACPNTGLPTLLLSDVPPESIAWPAVVDVCVNCLCRHLVPREDVYCAEAAPVGG